MGSNDEECGDLIDLGEHAKKRSLLFLLWIEPNRLQVEKKLREGQVWKFSNSLVHTGKFASWIKVIIIDLANLF